MKIPEDTAPNWNSKPNTKQRWKIMIQEKKTIFVKNDEIKVKIEHGKLENERKCSHKNGPKKVNTRTRSANQKSNRNPKGKKIN